MELNDIRNEINRLDDNMKSLFDKRLNCSKQVAEVKLHNHDEVFKPEREREIELRFGRDERLYLSYVKKIIELSRKYQYSIFYEAHSIDAAFLPWLKGISASNDAVLLHGGTLSLRVYGDETGEKGLSIKNILSVISDTTLDIAGLHTGDRADELIIKLDVHDNNDDKREAYILSYMLFKECIRA